MKTILKAALVSLPLIFATPAVSQVSVQIDIGNPYVRPWPDGVWVGGYYYYEPDYGRRVWMPGRWQHRHDNGRHVGWYKERGGHGHGHGGGHGHGRE
jgi:hypothetical protein